METGICDYDYVENRSGLTAEDTVAYTPSTVSHDNMATIQNAMGNMGGGMSGGMGGGMGGGPGGM